MKSFPFFHRLIWISDRDPPRLCVQNVPIYKLLKLSWLTAGVGRACGADNVNFGPGSTNSLNKKFLTNQLPVYEASYFFLKFHFRFIFPHMTRYVITKKYMYLSKDFKGIREILDRLLCLVDYLCLRSLWESLLRSAKAFWYLKGTSRSFSCGLSATYI